MRTARGAKSPVHRFVFLTYMVVSFAVSVIGGYPLPYVQDGLGFSATTTGHLRCRNPIPQPNMSDNRNWPLNFVKGSEAFIGAVFDGTSVWLVPMSADRVIRVDPVTKMMTSMSWPSGYSQTYRAFGAGVFDGTFVWLIPSNAYQLIRIRVTTGLMEGFSSWPSGMTVGGNSAFAGGVFDGTWLWLVPSSVRQLVRVDPTTGNTTGFTGWPSGLVFRPDWFDGGTFDGSSVWLVPHCADLAVSVNISTGVMTGYGNWPANFTKGQYAFTGGVFDGTFVWFVPHHADKVVKINVNTGVMQTVPNWPIGFAKGGSAFVGGIFDGVSIWLVPFFADRVIRIDTWSGNMTGLKRWPSGYVHGNYWSFTGGTFDGSSVWLVPCSADRVILIDACRKTSSSYSLTGSRTKTPLLSETRTEILTPSNSLSNERITSALTQTPSLSLPHRRIISTATKKARIPRVVQESITLSNAFGSTPSWTGSRSSFYGPAPGESTTLSATNIKARLTDANKSSILLNAAQAVTIVVGSETLGKIVVAAGLTGAAVSGLVSSPATMSRAGRMSSIARVLDCSFNDADSEPSYLDLPLQMQLGNGPFAAYAGSSLASCMTLLVIPFGILLAVAFLGRHHGGTFLQLVRKVQERIVSNFCFMSLGYIGPNILYAFVLVASHSGAPKEIGAVATSSVVVFCLLGLLVSVVIWKFSSWFHSIDPATESACATKPPLPVSQLRFENASPQSMLMESFGTVFDAARSAAPVVRSYFLEELLVSILLQCLSGVRPTGSSCGHITTSMTIVSAVHVLYLVAVRPYAAHLEFLFALLTALLILALSAGALCLSTGLVPWPS